MDNETLLGKAIPVPESYTREILRTIPIRAPSDMSVVLVSEEFTSVCPITGQPDFGKVVVTYKPVDKYIESKSFKLYLASFRNYKSFQEDITAIIADDLAMLLGCKTVVYVETDFVARGGVAIGARATSMLTAKVVTVEKGGDACQ